MTAAMAIPGNTAETFPVQFFGTGLADDRYVVERFRALADGDIRPIRPKTSGAKSRGRKGPAYRRSRACQSFWVAYLIECHVNGEMQHSVRLPFFRNRAL